MVISFIGHSSFPSCEDIKQLVKAELTKLLKSGESITCYLGGYGDFDMICATACKELRSQFENIESVYITPYPEIPRDKISNLYDASIYPPLENTPKRYAIVERNRWMMKEADLVLAYVKSAFGGASKALELATRLNKAIVNIYNLQQPTNESFG